VLKFIIIYPPCTRQTIPIVTSPPLFAAQMHANAHNSLRFLIIVAIYIPKAFSTSVAAADTSTNQAFALVTVVSWQLTRVGDYPFDPKNGRRSLLCALRN